MTYGQTLKDKLKNSDLKATPARLAVLEILKNSINPLDATSVLVFLQKHNISADQATIFRILNSFTKKGLTRQVNFNDGKSRYELSSDEEHHHLICTNCGSIEDISDCPIDELEKEIKIKKKFLIKTHSLEFFGICKKCQL